MGRPLWVDDPTFNIDYHVRHTALPQPGGIEQLRLLTGRIFSQRLDRTKPLWELWLVQGLEDNRFAVISKTHHSLVDGVSGVDLTTVLFDVSPTPSEPVAEDWTPSRSRRRHLWSRPACGASPERRSGWLAEQSVWHGDRSRRRPRSSKRLRDSAK